MPTVTAKLTPSTYYLSNSSYLSVSNASNMYADIDSDTYATVTNNRTSTSSYYIYLRGFDFSQVPDNAVVSRITIMLKAYHYGGNTGTIYCYDGTTQIAEAGSTTALKTSWAVQSFTNTTIDWETLKNYGSDFGIRINCRRASRNTTSYIYIYGAEIRVTYTAETVNVTGVTLDKNSISLEEGQTEQLTATVAPSNATNKSVTWSSSNTSVATVSNGLVTAVSAGSANITATTADGGYTATCAVTVTQPVLTQYRLTNTATPGKDYLIGNGDSGNIYLLSNESGGSRTLKGVAATVTNGIVSITSSTAAKCLFSLDLYTAGNDVTTAWSIGNQYIYCDNANGLRMNSPATLDRFWHYRDHKFWQFKSSASDGYSDTSSEYKYYLTWNNGNATDLHVDTAGIENSNIPPIYLFEEYTPSDSELYVKRNGAWTQVSKAYKKISGSWQEVAFDQVFQEGTNYVMG